MEWSISLETLGCGEYVVSSPVLVIEGEERL
jgi:hypothetical protein